MEEHMLIIEKGKGSHDFMRPLHDWLLASIRPERPEDAEANERNEYSNYIQTSEPTVLETSEPNKVVSNMNVPLVTPISMLLQQ